MTDFLLYLFPRAMITNYHKLGGLKQQRFIFLSSGAWVQNQGVGRVGSPWRLWGRDCPMPLSLLLVVALVFLGLWIHHSSLRLHLHMAFFPMCLFSLLIRTPVIRLGPTPIQYDLILIWLHLQRPYFQVRSHSQVLGRHEFWGVRGGLFNLVHLVTFQPTFLNT